MRKFMMMPLLLSAAIAGAQPQISPKVKEALPLPTVKALGFGFGQTSPLGGRGATVVGGQEATGWIELSGPAGCNINCGKVYTNGQPAGGMNVSLSSSNGTLAKVASIVFFHVGETRQTFTVLTSGVSAPTNVTISAWREGSPAQTATLQIVPPSLMGMSLDQSTLMSGASAHGTLTFNGTPASAGSIIVKLTSTNPAVTPVPNSVSLQPGNTVAAFDVKTTGVTADTSATITASQGDVKKTANVTVQPAKLIKFDGSVVQLNGAAPPSGAVVTLKSEDPDHVSVPPSVTIAGGSDKAGVQATEHRDYSNHSVKVSATYDGVTNNHTYSVLEYIKADLYFREVVVKDRFGNTVGEPKDSQPFKLCFTYGLTDVDLFRTLRPTATALHVSYSAPTGTGTSVGREFDLPVTFSATYPAGWRYKDSDEKHWWYEPVTCIDMPGLPQPGSYTDVTLVINPNHNNPDEKGYGNNTKKQRVTRQ